jgi:hypothetical protein
MGPVYEVFIHHTVTLAPNGDEKAELRSIQAAHMAAGASDIDYAWLIGRKGVAYVGRGWSVADGATGQDKDPQHPFDYYMGRSYGIAALGNYETTAPTVTQLNAYRELISQGIAGGFVLTAPTIRGHRDVRSTACPGKYLYAKLDYIRTPWVPPVTENELPFPLLIGG